MSRSPFFLTSKPPARLSFVRKIFKKGFALARLGRNGGLSLFDNDGPHARGLAIADLLAGVAPPPKTRWFVVNMRDQAQTRRPLPRLPVFGPCSGPDCIDVAAPDFTFGGWLEIGELDFDAACRAIAEAGANPPATEKLGWYGAVWSHKSRETLLAMGSEYPARMEIVDVPAYPAYPGVVDRPRSRHGLTMAAQAARFRYLIDVEGIGYSARLKYLFHAGRPLLIQSRPWRDYFLEIAKPWTHYVPIARDFSDLPAALDRLDANPAEAKAIGEAGRAFAARWLTKSAARAKWSALLDGTDPDSPWKREK